MSDLQRLESEHGIEVISGGIAKIYQLPDKNRITICLSTICEKSYDDETLDSTDRLFGERSTRSATKNVDSRKKLS